MTSVATKDLVLDGTSAIKELLASLLALHRVPRYLMDRYARAKQKQQRHSTGQKTPLRNLSHFGMLSHQTALRSVDN